MKGTPGGKIKKGKKRLNDLHLQKKKKKGRKKEEGKKELGRLVKAS